MKTSELISSVFLLWNKLRMYNKITFIIGRGKTSGILLQRSQIIFIVPQTKLEFGDPRDFFINRFLPVEAVRLSARHVRADPTLITLLSTLLGVYLIFRVMNIWPGLQPLIAAAALLTATAALVLRKGRYRKTSEDALAEHARAMAENARYRRVCETIADLFEKVLKYVREGADSAVVETQWSIYKLSVLKSRNGSIAVLERVGEVRGVL